MDSKDQNLNLIRTKQIHFCPFQSIFICWTWNKKKCTACKMCSILVAA